MTVECVENDIEVHVSRVLSGDYARFTSHNAFSPLDLGPSRPRALDWPVRFYQDSMMSSQF